MKRKNKNNGNSKRYKIFLFILFYLFVLIIILKSISQSKNYLIISENIYKEKFNEFTNVKSKKIIINGDEFIIHFMSYNKDYQCLGMPAIRIAPINSNKKFVYFQIIKTNSLIKINNIKNPQCFIDSNKEFNFYPLYTINNIFVDIPIWHYSGTYKPLTYWIASTYILEDNNDTTYTMIGKIKWGFKFEKNKTLTTLINPTIISLNKIKINKEFLEKNYKNLK